ncbi:hypothetical protein GCK72_003081 [Caenorhabditis remanei]|uniref:Uncharacterized protein n=1 Tax=Caenorhabditis remanei TaxID=31234 RepID=A0A6A5HUH2_CAERE|nr:hypothetical protein GCK72_003081 [Caenorhabditis remanei]KAF1771255.1 hypothetical protein GCK72_003081 [Caenorhabditis remanei]
MSRQEFSQKCWINKLFLFVAAIRRTSFSIWDGTQTNTQHVGESGQFVLELPDRWSAYIGSNIIFGQSNEFRMMYVAKNEDTEISEPKQTEQTLRKRPQKQKHLEHMMCITS